MKIKCENCNGEFNQIGTANYCSEACFEIHGQDEAKPKGYILEWAFVDRKNDNQNTRDWLRTPQGSIKEFDDLDSAHKEKSRMEKGSYGKLTVEVQEGW